MRSVTNAAMVLILHKRVSISVARTLPTANNTYNAMMVAAIMVLYSLQTVMPSEVSQSSMVHELVNADFVRNAKSINAAVQSRLKIPFVLQLL